MLSWFILLNAEIFLTGDDPSFRFPPERPFPNSEYLPAAFPKGAGAERPTSSIFIMEHSRETIAMLIDADNSPSDKIDFILSEMAKYGVVNIRRAYGNWKSHSLKGWEDKLHDYAIRPIQQFDYTKGKNATDMAMTIDAMDLLYSKKLDAFCIVSSDSDFTPLVMRILSEGLNVYGFGQKSAPAPFVNACSTFLYVESFCGGQEKARNDGGRRKSSSQELKRDSKLLTLVRNAVDSAQEEDGWSNLAKIGKHISNQASFDPRNYGFKRLSDLIRSIDLFETEFRNNNSELYIRDRRKARKPEGSPLEGAMSSESALPVPVTAELDAEPSAERNAPPNVPASPKPEPSRASAFEVTAERSVAPEAFVAADVAETSAKPEPAVSAPSLKREERQEEVASEVAAQQSEAPKAAAPVELEAAASASQTNASRSGSSSSRRSGRRSASRNGRRELAAEQSVEAEAPAPASSKPESSAPISPKAESPKAIESKTVESEAVAPKSAKPEPVAETPAEPEVAASKTEGAEAEAAQPAPAEAKPKKTTRTRTTRTRSTATRKTKAATAKESEASASTTASEPAPVAATEPAAAESPASAPEPEKKPKRTTRRRTTRKKSEPESEATTPAAPEE